MITRRSAVGALLAGVVVRPKPDYLLMDLAASRVIEHFWSAESGESAGIDAPHFPGSLWKPFLAAAGPRPFPVLECTGQCWLARRHGTLGIVEALAQSCNRWFDQLLPSISRNSLSPFGLQAGETDQWAEWPATPRRLAFAYAELLARSSQSGFTEILAGLRAASDHGTAKALGAGFLAKTGTSRSARHAGDGWVMAAWPAALPSRLVLYRQPGIPGAHAAAELKLWLRQRVL